MTRTQWQTLLISSRITWSALNTQSSRRPWAVLLSDAICPRDPRKCLQLLCRSGQSSCQCLWWGGRSEREKHIIVSGMYCILRGFVSALQTRGSRLRTSERGSRETGFVSDLSQGSIVPALGCLCQSTFHRCDEKIRDKPSQRRKHLFGCMVAEGSVHGYLALLFWGLGWCRISRWGV